MPRRTRAVHVQNSADGSGFAAAPASQAAGRSASGRIHGVRMAVFERIAAPARQGYRPTHASSCSRDTQRRPDPWAGVLCLDRWRHGPDGTAAA